ncbi:UNVERIFIED_CONTAM: hypothetical protein HDU68_009057 [Siphonaria sp. JEL0065]|nr:hypothetical protein HDU68_009057 [Siphonaria sp. JEL0065]
MKQVTGTATACLNDGSAAVSHISVQYTNPDANAVATTKEEHIGLHNLPSEILQEILILLPLYVNMLPIALASKHFAALLHGSELFAKRHIHFFFGIPTVQSLVLSNKRGNWQLPLPLNYQRILFQENQDQILDCAIIDGFRDSNVPFLKTIISSLKQNLNPYLEKACLYNRSSLIPSFLARSAVDPKLLDEKTLVSVVSNGFESVLECLLKDGRIQVERIQKLTGHFSPSSYNLIEIAITSGHGNLVNILLEDGRVDPCHNKNNALLMAVQKGCADVVEVLIKDGRVQDQIQRVGSVEVLKLLIKDKRVEVGVVQKSTAELSANVIEIVFMSLPELKCASIVKVLLEDGRANPSYNNNNALLVAVKKGYTTVVELLIKDKRVEVGVVQKSTAELSANVIEIALMSLPELKCASIVKVLLEDGRVDPSYNNNNALLVAVEKGYTTVVELLIKDERVQVERVQKLISLSSFNLIEMAIVLGPSLSRRNLVKLLLDDGKVDPCHDGNRALVLAVEKGYLDVVELLLMDTRVNRFLEKEHSRDATSASGVLVSTVKNGHAYVVKLLLGNEWIVLGDILAVAKSFNNKLVLRVLLGDPRIADAVSNNVSKGEEGERKANVSSLSNFMFSSFVSVEPFSEKNESVLVAGKLEEPDPAALSFLTMKFEIPQQDASDGKPAAKATLGKKSLVGGARSKRRW